jgi:hypothetical protein
MVWVGDGVYSTGGKVLFSNLLNRVALDKPVTVQSVNGPLVTIINGTLPGGNAVRCAWLTNGAVLKGFTLIGGKTGFTFDPNQVTNLNNGGGVWCASGTAIVADCIIVGNTATFAGGGAYNGTLTNCVLKANTAAHYGGASASCALMIGCLLAGNSAVEHGGGDYGGNLQGCTITNNTANYGGGVAYSDLQGCLLQYNGAYSGAAYSATLLNCSVTRNVGWGTDTGGVGSSSLTNSIVYANTSILSSVYSNYASSTFSYCCSSPMPPGDGNIGDDPQLLSDGAHISWASPCRGAGDWRYSSGADIDNQTWSNPPSMGCDEWHPEVVFVQQPHLTPIGAPAQVGLETEVTGEDPLYQWWKDGSPLTADGHYYGLDSAHLLIQGFGPMDAGTYWVVASNAFGMRTGEVVQLTVHCVDPNSFLPTPPFSDWLTAAQTIQGAIDIADDGDFVVVTNGTYSSGVTVLNGGTRIYLDKRITVMSASGPEVTIIEGQLDPATGNGPASVRCAFLTAGCLDGFTLEGGATGVGYGQDAFGGGAYCGSRGLLVNCIVRNNQGQNGAGVYQGVLQRCTLSNNWADLSGGGANGSLLTNCTLVHNRAGWTGGGAFGGTAVRCTMAENTAGQGGGGAAQTQLINCKILENFAGGGGGLADGTAQGTLLMGNTAEGWGGGAAGGGFDHCTFTRNVAYVAGGLYGGNAQNCILWDNVVTYEPGSASDVNWMSTVSMNYCCTTPAGYGYSNIVADPILLDGSHIALSSPCRGAAVPSSATLFDLDGEFWATPASIGCEEVWEQSLTGPIGLFIQVPSTQLPVNCSIALIAQVTGQISRLDWSFGDGTFLSNVGGLVAHTWSNTGDYSITLTGFNR